jgi:hypothetical protein
MTFIDIFWVVFYVILAYWAVMAIPAILFILVCAIAGLFNGFRKGLR